MINITLYAREMKNSAKLLIIFLAIITMYVGMLIAMYDPELMKSFDKFYELMPELMAAVGMKPQTYTLISFMESYLYGFILVVFPMVFSIIRGNGLIAKYADNGALSCLLATPIKRKKLVLTQMAVLLSGIGFLILYTTVIEIIISEIKFSGKLDIASLVKLNLGLLFLQMFIAAICFLASCCFTDVKQSLALGAGLPSFMYILQMLSNANEKLENIKYLTFFTLFDSGGLATGEMKSLLLSTLLLMGSVVIMIISCMVFCRKDYSV